MRRYGNRSESSAKVLLLRPHEPLRRGDRGGTPGEKGRGDRLRTGQRLRHRGDDGKISSSSPFRHLCPGKSFVMEARSDQPLSSFESVGSGTIKKRLCGAVLAKEIPESPAHGCPVRSEERRVGKGRSSRAAPGG